MEDEFQKLYHRNRKSIRQKCSDIYADMKRHDVNVPNIIPFLF